MNRDQFAAVALNGLMVKGPPKDLPVEQRTTEQLVRMAYEIADEMVRQQKHDADNEILELACAASDVWVEYWQRLKEGDAAARMFMPQYADTLSRLEEATRSRPMRKVRP